MARIFQNWLEGYMRYTQASEAQNAFHFWCGVGTIAGALRRNVWIDQLGFQWSPNFYIFLVGPAGVVTKSTSLDYGMVLLEEVPDVFLGPPSATWQGLMPALQEAIMTVKWTDPSGKEKHTTVSPLTIPVSELGTFLKANDDAFMSFLIDLWDGKLSKRDFTHRTQTRGEIRVQNPWINIIGCTTTAWLQANVPEALVGGGFFSRVLFIYGEKKRRLVAYPSREWNMEEFNALKRDLISDLKQISLLRGPYTLTEEAFEWGEAWYKTHWTTAQPHMVSTRYQPYKGRKQTQLHKLAMVLAAARSDKLEITVDHLKEAEELLTTVEASMIVVFESIGGVDDARYIKEILGLIRGFAPLHPNGLVPLVEVWSRLVNVMGIDDFHRALSAGTQAGLFKLKATGKFSDTGKSIMGISYIEPAV